MPIRIIFSRTFARIASLGSSAFAVIGFLSASAILFAYLLFRAEGVQSHIVYLWASSIAPFLPFLAAFLSMDSLSDDRRTGRIDNLLSIAIRESDIVLGKYLGILAWVASTLIFSLASNYLIVCAMMPDIASDIRLLSFIPALLILVVQGILWCAISLLMSAFFRHSASAACASLALILALPFCLWKAASAFWPSFRHVVGSFPLFAHISDFSSGLLSVGVLLSYLICTGFALFIAVQRVKMYRLVGRMALTMRSMTVGTVICAFLAAILAVFACSRIRLIVDLPIDGAQTVFSPRTRQVLSELTSGMKVTCFMSRNDSRFRKVSQFLRALKSEAESMGLSRFVLTYVDPRWDLGEAEVLIRRGIEVETIVFESGHRRQAVHLGADFGERACVSAMRALTIAARHRTVYWTVGHAENSVTDYGPFGMSDIVREMTREGYANVRLDLTSSAVPADCSMIVVAGAKDDFSRTELDRIDAYLREGGRLLVLQTRQPSSSLLTLLSSWGITQEPFLVKNYQTLTGSEVVASDFSEHVLSSSLKGSRVTFSNPISFRPSAATVGSVRADGIVFSPLVKVGSSALAVAAERGVETGTDLAIRPTRLVVIGDPLFVSNGPLSARALANRDFFMNCIAYLAGIDMAGSVGIEAGVLASGLDRGGRIRHLVVMALVLPGVLFVLWFFVMVHRRRRT